MVERSCRRCGASFEVPYPSSDRVNCSACRGKHRPGLKRGTRADKGTRKAQWVEVTCPECGKHFDAPPNVLRNADASGGRVFCTNECYVAHRDKGHVMTKTRRPVGRPPRGARYVDSHGYVLIYVPPNERPPGCERRTSLPEHRIVMAKHLGRHLLPSETVHHKNGNKQDNRIENLELWSKNHTPGQDVTDQLEWAREIIARYEPIEDSLT